MGANYERYRHARDNRSVFEKEWPAVLVEHSTDEGGKLRSEGPARGKVTPGHDELLKGTTGYIKWNKQYYHTFNGM